jgi:hypothetical protein
MLEREIPEATSPQTPRNGDEVVTNSPTITGDGKEESGAPLSQEYGQESQNDSEVKEFEGFNEDSLMDGNVQEWTLPIMQPPNYVQGGYSRLLEGYKSPTGGTIRATLDLGSLMFAAVAAESVNRISLMAQQDANEKLVKQAEQHRELMEKEFTANLARIREEHQKTIDETIRIRDECAQLYEKAHDLGEDYLQKVDAIRVHEKKGGQICPRDSR